MNNRRRVIDLGLEITPDQPWQAQQRNKILKFRNERLDEFEQTCLEAFDWLENFYQGCSYAARQNRNPETEELEEAEPETDQSMGGAEDEQAFIPTFRYHRSPLTHMTIATPSFLPSFQEGQACTNSG